MDDNISGGLESSIQQEMGTLVRISEKETLVGLWEWNQTACKSANPFTYGGKSFVLQHCFASKLS